MQDYLEDLTAQLPPVQQSLKRGRAFLILHSLLQRQLFFQILERALPPVQQDLRRGRAFLILHSLLQVQLFLKILVKALPLPPASALPHALQPPGPSPPPQAPARTSA